MADTNACPRCGKPVICGMKSGMARCWCADFPPLLKVPAAEEGAGCYCPECLKVLTGESRAESGEAGRA